jgi:uncharacterized DUF497 family protein
MDFEFDAEKSASNKDKHGIDFVEAQALWHYNRCLIVPAKSSGELRFALIAKLGEKHWVAFYTLRGDTVRVISVRRARDMEKQRYEAHIS